MHNPSYANGYPTAAAPAADQWQGQPGTAAGTPTSGGAAYGSAAGGYGYAPGYGMMQGAYAYPRSTRPSTGFLDFSNDRFLKGLLIGAAATYLLTNESVQRAAIKGVVTVWAALQSGIEEAKERFHDAEAELHHAAQAKKDAD